MSFQQLLNPKGFAKEKNQKKKASNHGPSQTRKPNPPGLAELKPNVPKFDPKALLNPKAAAARQRLSSADVKYMETLPNRDGEASIATDNEQPDEQPGMSNLIERQYRVTNREAVAPRKRKSEPVAEDDETEHKKTKTTFNGGSNGGIIGDYLRSEREKGAAEFGPVTEPIDLTNEEDDEVVFVGETLADGGKEVCLGRLFATASVFRIPRAPKHQTGALPENMWPHMRINYRRVQAQNYMIDLFDSQPGGAHGAKFGNLDATVAVALSPLLDGSHVNKLRLKIFLDPFKREKGEYPGSRVSRTVKTSIILYAPREKAKGIGNWLSQKSQWLADPINPGRGIEYFNPMIPENYAATKTAGARKPQSSQPNYGVARTQEEMLRETSNMFDELVKRDGIPEMDADGTVVYTPLMSHQKKALHFMIEHERGQDGSAEEDSAFSLWKPRTTNKGQKWYNIITNHEVRQRPEPVRGGILADMMGLGKTLSILALITSTMDDARVFGHQDPPIDMEDVKRNAKTTLIICPKSVLTNWEEQIRLHTKPDRLKVYSYHGPSRIQDLDQLASHNIILTSYSTAAAEFGDTKQYKRKALASIQWFRVVLDEAHQIRTQSTQVSKACCALHAQRRWAVTGTPVQNRLDDLGALIKFLHIKPFDDNSSWAHHILAPLKTGSANAQQHLRLLVHGITLRRMKDTIDLTDRQEHVVRLDFSDDEMGMYREFSKSSHIKLKIMLRETGRLKGKSYAHVLKSLSRLRAICAHGREMLGEDDLKELEGLTSCTAIELGDEPDLDNPADDSFITDKHAYETLHMMSESDVDMCTSCGGKVGDKKVDPDAVDDDSAAEIEDEDQSSDSVDLDADANTLGYLTPCYHLICTKCKDKHVHEAQPKLTDDHYYSCPYCEQYVRFGLFKLRRSDLQSILDAKKNANKKAGKAKWDESTYSGPHTKVKALLEDLKRSAAETAELSSDEPPIRSVVFSGWTSYLDLIEYALDENNIGFQRLDGSMSIKARSKVLETFKTDPTITVLLVSIKAGGQGLNFTAANKVYMMEPQFNPGVEQQAIDRVHRLGQKRDVDIKHYIMNESVEEKILKLQEKKQKLAQWTMEKKLSKAEEAAEKVEELRDLFK